MRRQATVIAIGVLCGVAAAWGWSTWKRAQQRPNVVLIIGCTLRKDQLTPYGGHPEATPFLQRWAEEGAIFADAFTNGAWTKVGSTALLTGQHPVSIGMVEPGDGGNRKVLPPEVTTLAERFHDAGYFTAGLTANPNLNRIFGFDQGFDQYFEANGFRELRDEKIDGGRVVDEAMTFLDGRPTDRPAYLQVLLIDAHQPARVRPAEAAPYQTEDAPVRVAEYRALLRRFDEAVENLHGQLRARGFTDANTVTALVNDHGEGLRWPHHHGIAHGNFLYPSVVGMVWLLRGPGVPAGRVVDGLAQQIDVVPTLLSLAGLPASDGPGVDRAPAVRGDQAETGEQRIFVDTWFQFSNKAAVYTPDRMCEHNWREKIPGPPVQCFDRASDPYFRRPTTPEGDPLVAALDAWRAARVADYAAWPHTTNAVINEDLRAQLEALGYAQGDAADAPGDPEAPTADAPGRVRLKRRTARAERRGLLDEEPAPEPAAP